MNTRWKSVAFTMGALVLAGGFFVSLAESQGVFPSRFNKAVSIVKDALSAEYLKQLARGSGECDQSATSTDCATIAQALPISPDMPDGTKPNSTFSSLKNTYTDSKYGFSLQYPDELTLVNGGDPQLVDSRNEKAFSLKICNPESPCGRELADASVKSAQDVQKAYVFNQYSDGGVQYREEVEPLSNIPFQAEGGTSILKQSYKIVIRDPNGMDVTERECEMCSRQKERYVLFKSANNYMIIQITGLNNDKTLEEKIVRSIIY